MVELSKIAIALNVHWESISLETSAYDPSLKMLVKELACYTIPKCTRLHLPCSKFMRERPELKKGTLPSYLNWSLTIISFKLWLTSKAFTRHDGWVIIFHLAIPFLETKYYKSPGIISLFPWKMLWVATFICSTSKEEASPITTI